MTSNGSTRDTLHNFDWPISYIPLERGSQVLSSGKIPSTSNDQFPRNQPQKLKIYHFFPILISNRSTRGTLHNFDRPINYILLERYPHGLLCGKIVSTSNDQFPRNQPQKLKIYHFFPILISNRSTRGTLHNFDRLISYIPLERASQVLSSGKIPATSNDQFFRNKPSKLKIYHFPQFLLQIGTLEVPFTTLIGP